MDDYASDTYGERHADIYDERLPDYDESAIEMLARLAGAGRALELGVGTGRIALPLAARGVEVHGIDASPRMVERMRAKPGGDSVRVTFGDFAGVEVEGEFALVYVVFNTIFALLTQDEQVRCFRNVARRLAPGGRFLVEAFVPDTSLHPGGQSVKVGQMTSDLVELHVTLLDAAEQMLVGQQIRFDGAGVKLYPVQLRYAWPSELDLMARLAGLRLRERHAGWQGEPFDARSTKHVSVYAREGDAG